MKPWYLDEKCVIACCRLPVVNLRSNLLSSAAYLRQSILLTAYETPETRSVFNQSLKNLAGRVRTTRRWVPVEVPDGLDQVGPPSILYLQPELNDTGQNFVKFDCSNVKDEPDKRFAYFTTQVWAD